MQEVAERFKGGGEDGVTGAACEVGYKTNAAGVVLELRVIEQALRNVVLHK